MTTALRIAFEKAQGKVVVEHGEVKPATMELVAKSAAKREALLLELVIEHDRLKERLESIVKRCAAAEAAGATRLDHSMFWRRGNRSPHKGVLWQIRKDFDITMHNYRVVGARLQELRAA